MVYKTHIHVHRFMKRSTGKVSPRLPRVQASHRCPRRAIIISLVGKRKPLQFLSLKSQLPSVEDSIAIHYAINGLYVGHLYSHCTRGPPSSLQELYQLFEHTQGMRTCINASSRRNASPRSLRTLQISNPGLEDNSDKSSLRKYITLLKQ